MPDFLRSFLAGGVAGCMVDLALFPLDSLKTKIQTKQPLDFSINSLYKGLSWSLSSSFPCAATFWLAYTVSKFIFTELLLDSYFLDFICAIIGSFFCCLVRCPFELLKTLMISGKVNNFYEAPMDVVAKSGFLGLYVGFFALICRELPFDGIQMIFYRIFSRFEILSYMIGPFSISGALAGGVTAFLTTPVDVVKAKIMTDSEKYHSVAQSIKIILASEGIQGLWRGWKMRVLFITIGGWIYFGAFQLLIG